MADNVNHPAHYGGFSNGAEVIDITENLTFNGGNAIKYVARSTRIDPTLNKGDQVEDLQKALWYITREIDRLYEVDQPDDWFSGVFNDRIYLDTTQSSQADNEERVAWELALATARTEYEE